MKNRNTYFVLALLGVGFFVLGGVGCTKEALDFEKYGCDTCVQVETRNTLNVPLLSANIKLGDFFLKSSNGLILGNDGGYYIEKVDTIFALGSQDVLQEIQATPSLSQEEGIPLLAGGDTSVVVFMDVNTHAVVSDIQLKSITLINDDTLSFKLQTGDTVLVTASVFDFSTGKPLLLTQTPMMFPRTPQVDTLLMLPADIPFALNTDPTKPYNRLPVRLDIKGKRSGTSQIFCSISYNPFTSPGRMDWKAITGFLGTGLFPPQEKTIIQNIANPFRSSKLSYEHLLFDGSYFEFKTYNEGMGIPTWKEQKVQLKQGGQSLLTETVRFFDDYPFVQGDRVETTRRVFGQQWDSAISQFPEQAVLSGKVEVNKGRTGAIDTTQFLQKDMRHGMTVYLFVPMRLAVLDTLKYRDTLRTKGLVDTTKFTADAATLYFNGLNKFPTSVNARIVIFGQDGSRLDSISLSEENLPIPAAQLDGQGKAVQSTEFHRRVDLTWGQIRHMTQGFAVVEMWMNKDMGGGGIQFTNEDYMSLGVGMDIHIRYIIYRAK